MKARFAFAEIEPDDTPIPPEAPAAERPALVRNHAADPQARDAVALPRNGRARRIAERRHSRPRVRRKRFAERTAGQARTAAGEWLHDFSSHGPLQIRKITTDRHRDIFLTMVIYTRG